jgi:hypothetical protein
VPRAQAVTVEALDHNGDPVRIEASGWYARILQHEIDHLDGTLYIDRMHTRTFTTTRNLTQMLTGLEQVAGSEAARGGDAPQPLLLPAEAGRRDP